MYKDYMLFLENPKKMRDFCKDNADNFKYDKCESCKGTGLTYEDRMFGMFQYVGHGELCKECNGSGGKIKIINNFEIYYICDDCEGRGSVPNKRICKRCNGKGWLYWVEKILL